MKRVLVAYATKHHSTAEIAGVIGEELLDSCALEVDVRSVEEVVDLELYEAVVLGSAIYAGQWQQSAVDFLRRYESALSQRPVWIFSSGPTGQGDPNELTKGWKFPDAVQSTVERIKPRDVILFHGNLDGATLSFFERSIVKLANAPSGDFRDWEMIQSWAATIVAALVPASTDEIELNEG